MEKSSTIKMELLENGLDFIDNSLKPILDSMWNWGENYKRTIQ